MRSCISGVQHWGQAAFIPATLWAPVDPREPRRAPPRAYVLYVKHLAQFVVSLSSLIPWRQAAGHRSKLENHPTHACTIIKLSAEALCNSCSVSEARIALAPPLHPRAGVPQVSTTFLLSPQPLVVPPGHCWFSCPATCPHVVPFVPAPSHPLSVPVPCRLCTARTAPHRTPVPGRGSLPWGRHSRGTRSHRVTKHRRRLDTPASIWPVGSRRFRQGVQSPFPGVSPTGRNRWWLGISGGSPQMSDKRRTADHSRCTSVAPRHNCQVDLPSSSTFPPPGPWHSSGGRGGGGGWHRGGKQGSRLLRNKLSRANNGLISLCVASFLGEGGGGE